MKSPQTILKVLVGSHAHGLASPQSDYDYRSVFVTPASELLRLGGNTKTTSWIEGEEDNTSYELGHFLQLATKSNSSILEVFKAPIVETGNTILSSIPYNHYGEQLRRLFPYVWSSLGVYNAFKGYSHNQHKKLFDDREEFAKRRGKYAVAYIRVLLQGIELLRTGDFHVDIQHIYPQTPEPNAVGMSLDGWRDFLRAVREQQISIGEVVDNAEELKDSLKAAYESNPNKMTDLEPINDFLLRVRKEMW